MASWDRICEILCERLKEIFDGVGIKESDLDDFFREYEDQIKKFVDEKAREFQKNRDD